MVADDGDLKFSNRSRTIDVDGVQRPTTNANGKRISDTEDNIRNFWRWSVAGMGRGRVESQGQTGQKYGRSQGADEGDTARRYFFDADGRPNVYYHGTSDDIEAFQVGHPRRKDNGWLGRGIYVTSEPSVANSYTNLKRGTSSPNVMPLYIGLQKPSLADLSFAKSDLKAAEDAVIEALAQYAEDREKGTQPGGPLKFSNRQAAPKPPFSHQRQKPCLASVQRTTIAQGGSHAELLRQGTHRS